MHSQTIVPEVAVQGVAVYVGRLVRPFWECPPEVLVADRRAGLEWRRAALERFLDVSQSLSSSLPAMHPLDLFVRFAVEVLQLGVLGVDWGVLQPGLNQQQHVLQLPSLRQLVMDPSRRRTVCEAVVDEMVQVQLTRLNASVDALLDLLGSKCGTFLVRPALRRCIRASHTLSLVLKHEGLLGSLEEWSRQRVLLEQVLRDHLDILEDFQPFQEGENDASFSLASLLQVASQFCSLLFHHGAVRLLWAAWNTCKAPNKQPSNPEPQISVVSQVPEHINISVDFLLIFR